jgi:hypothetical protein
MQSTIRLFADDCTIYRPINNKNDQQILQSDLTNLTKWEQKWKMAFNVSKCNVMHLTRSRNPIKNHTICTTNNLKLFKTPSTYLGITIKDDLIWNLHINNIVFSANRVQGMLGRNIKKAPQQTKITAINTLVRPRVEYSIFVNLVYYDWKTHLYVESHYLVFSVMLF